MTTPDEDFENTIDTSKGTVFHVSRWNGKHSTGAPKRGEPGSDEYKRLNAADRHRAEAKGIEKTTPYPGDFVLTFGKHKGLRMREIPRNYVCWLADAVFKAGSPMAHAQIVARMLLDRHEENFLDAEFQSLVASF